MNIMAPVRIITRLGLNCHVSATNVGVLHVNLQNDDNDHHLPDFFYTSTTNSK